MLVCLGAGPKGVTKKLSRWGMYKLPRGIKGCYVIKSLRKERSWCKATYVARIGKYYTPVDRQAP